MPSVGLQPSLVRFGKEMSMQSSGRDQALGGTPAMQSRPPLSWGAPALVMLSYVALLLLICLMAPSPVYPSSCGGAGQRACCIGEATFGACQSGLTQAPECSGDCLCGGFIPLGFTSTRACAQTERCGGPGQRACCLFEADFGACRSGLAKVPGCGGNCLCSNGLGASSDSHCAQTEPCGGPD